MYCFHSEQVDQPDLSKLLYQFAFAQVVVIAEEKIRKFYFILSSCDQGIETFVRD